MVKISDITQNSRVSIDSTIASKNVQKRFGKPEDNVELFILDGGNNIVYSEENFSEYLAENINEGLFSEFNMDPVALLRNKGFTVGKYKIVLNIHRKRIFNDYSKNFKITEISPSRREIRTVGQNIDEERLEKLIRIFVRDIENSILFKDYALNFGNNRISTAINIQVNKRGRSLEILFKLFEPLPISVSNNSTFRIIEEITDPISLNVDMGTPEELDETEQLQGPNFKIDVRLNNSVPSSFKTYNDVLNYNFTSSYQNLLNQLENKEIPEIQYDYIRPVSSSLETVDIPYHFENFVHFSSATERLKNFEYKLKLIESYNKEIADINNIGGSTSTENFILVAKEDINQKIEKLIKGFDGYEQFLYFTSGSDYTWPKETTSYPYQLYHTSHSVAKTWLGNENSAFPNYGGQLVSASLYDRQNEYGLTNLIPKHITDNPDNNFYQTFVNMIGHHFDLIWTYIKAITDINNTDNISGISKELVYLQLKSLGIETFDQFENSNLIEYILGHGTGSQEFYNAPASQTLVTASNAGSLPKRDIAKEVWKRVYHNAPYLLKTKGTERGIKALMSCYGIPASLLNVKEYAGATSVTGPLKDIDLADFYKTFSYEKASLALKVSTEVGAGNFMVRFPWKNNGVSNRTAKSIELRVKPVTGNEGMILSLGDSTTDSSGLQLHLDKYTGTDISSSGDASTFGRLQLKQGSTLRASTDYFPLYNKDFWNVHLMGTGTDVSFGAYQTNHLKNTFKYTGTWDSNNYNNTFGTNNGQGRTYIHAGSVGYEGSIQELKSNFGEILSDTTLTKHSLEPFMYSGNTISSSFSNTIIRLPLGSTDVETLENHTPDISLTNADTLAEQQGVTTVFEEVIETHHHPTPDTVGISMTSEKVRIDEGTVDNNILSINIKSETSTLDRQPPDYEDLGVFFSPTTEINEDIIYTLGGFRLDDFIGSPLPSAQTSSKYENLKDIRDIYFQKVHKRYNYWDYIKTIQYIDHTLFKLVEQFVPAKANLKTGLLIEPHYLERNKFARELPTISDGQTMTQGSYQTFDFRIDPERSLNLQGSSVVTTNNLLSTTDSTGRNKIKLEQGTNVTIDIDDYILDEVQNISQAPITPGTGVKKSNTLLGNAIKGKLSNIYYRKLTDGKETDY